MAVYDRLATPWQPAHHTSLLLIHYREEGDTQLCDYENPHLYLCAASLHLLLHTHTHMLLLRPHQSNTLVSSEGLICDRYRVCELVCRVCITEFEKEQQLVKHA